MTTLDAPQYMETQKQFMSSDGKRTPVDDRRISRVITEDQICILTFDRPGAQANLFDRITLNQLNTEINTIASLSNLRGLILASAKNSIFVAGADIKSIAAAANPQAIKQIIELGQQVFTCLANLPIPKVAAIHGACLGGGYEVCLACDYRIASSDKRTKIGLPEVKLGIIPGWGGTTRLPRLIGIPDALEVILAGKVLSAKSALKLGMIDAIVDRNILVETAIRIINEKGESIIQRSLPLKTKLLNLGITSSVIKKRLLRTLVKKTRGHYPAPIKALEVATKGITRSSEGSLLLERDAVVELTQSSICKNLIQVFFLQERAKKLGSSALNLSPSIEQIAVIGAGVMGAGIAQWSSSKGVKVILKDIAVDQVAKGMSCISNLYAQGVKRRAFSQVEAQSGMDRIYPTAKDVPLQRTDLIIEAAVERMDVKKSIFKNLATQVAPSTILATNTSALSITELSECVSHPERVVGIHFFNPVQRMQLVEVVVGDYTCPAVVQRALGFVHQLGKFPIEVRDRPGFLVNRILMPYLVEAGRLFEQGFSVKDIDESMLDFGMPMGPLRLIDEVGVDVAKHVADTLSSHFPDRLTVPRILNEMLENKLLGKKGKAGFYTYAKRDKTPRLNSALNRFQRNHQAQGNSRKLLSRRMLLLMINEAARCLEEGVVKCPEDVDFGMIMGTGFAPFRGGPLRFADQYGIVKLVQEMTDLTAAGQAHFTPSALLQNMAQSNITFYSDMHTNHECSK